MEFEVLMAANIKITVFWDVMPCSSVKRSHRFGGIYCLHLYEKEMSQVGRKVSYV
jgi:hypothetical protein